MANKAIRYRLYPTQDQRIFFARTFGCCRKVWNLMLSERQEVFRNEHKNISPSPAKYKKEYPYLREVDSLALANVQLDLNDAFKRYFKVPGTGHPKFKSKKRAKKSYTTNNQNGTIRLETDSSCIHLPKVGDVKAVFHRLPQKDWKLKSATVSCARDGKYYCSVLFEYEDECADVEHPELNAVGLDYKSDGLYVSSDGEIPGSLKSYRKTQKARTREQRKLRHKEKGSNNWNKQQKRIAKVNARAANQRKDYLNKISTGIANRYDMVCVETLNMRAMSNKGFRNGKATMDNGYGMFVNMLEYKLNDRGKKLIRIDKWYPSSQTCHNCGCVNPEVKDLKVRKWTCPKCGAEHDRDLNAALNIRDEGVRQYFEELELQAAAE